ncbi:MAG: ABC transporter substrate-binding protein, partial [Chloroflexota bacterium]
MGQVSRRRLLRGAIVTVGGLAGAAMVGCSSAPKPDAPAAAPQAAGTSAPAGKTYPKGALVPINKGAIKPGGTFTEAVSNVAPEFDSHTALTSMQWRTSGDLAILPDVWDGSLIGGLVESWETPDATTVILKLRDKLPLHDIGQWTGKNFEAEDLAFNINRIAGSTAKAENLPKEVFQRASTMAGLVSAEATDKTHVKIKLDSPRGQWLSGFTDHRNFMMPKGVVEVGFKDASKLAGTGAFSVTSIDSTKEVYTRFDKWWGGKANFDKYVRIALPDRAAQTAAFVSKQTQH